MKIISPTKADILWIHILRVVACAMVVLLHTQPVVSECVGFDKEFYKLIVLFTRPCVPIFFMITGFLILPYKDDNCFIFYKKRIPKILFPLLIWGCIYAIAPMIAGLYDIKTMSIELLLSPIKAPGEMGGILWYLFVLLGIYVFIPFLTCNIYENKRMMLTYLMLWIMSSIVVFVSEKFPLVLGNNPYMPGVNMTIYFSGYLGFLLLGYTIKNNGIHSIAENLRIRYKLNAFTKLGGGNCLFCSFILYCF